MTLTQRHGQDFRSQAREKDRWRLKRSKRRSDAHDVALLNMERLRSVGIDFDPRAPYDCGHRVRELLKPWPIGALAMPHRHRRIGIEDERKLLLIAGENWRLIAARWCEGEGVKSCPSLGPPASSLQVGIPSLVEPIRALVMRLAFKKGSPSLSQQVIECRPLKPVESHSAAQIKNGIAELSCVI